MIKILREILYRSVYHNSSNSGLKIVTNLVSHLKRVACVRDNMSYMWPCQWLKKHEDCN